MKSKSICTLWLFILVSLATTSAVAQQKLSKEALVERSNLLFESGRPQAALELLAEYPEYAAEREILYVKSVSYVALRDFVNADAAFQQQFDAFRRDGDESRAAAEKIVREDPPTKENKSLAALMYSTALMSYGTAQLADSLRAVALEKAGIPAARRTPKNLAGFDEFVRIYAATALATAALLEDESRWREALDMYKKAIELEPQNAAAYAARAKVYRRLKQIRLAARDEAAAKRLALKK